MLMQIRTRQPWYRQVVLCLVGLLFVILPLAACDSSGSPAQSTPTTQPQFTTFDLHLPTAALNAPVVGPLPDSTIMNVGISFKINQDLLNKMDQQQVKSGQGTDLSTLANQIGISDQTYQQIKDFFGVSDAKLKLNKLHSYLAVNAKAQTFAAVFQTRFVRHKLNGRTYYIPETSPKLPTVFAKYITAITGLDNFTPPPQFHSYAQARIPAQHTQPAADCSASNVVTPAQIAHVYEYDRFFHNGWYGQHMNVNLVEGASVDPNDIQNYFACVNFAGQFKTIDVGNPATFSADSSGEATLDIDMVAGLAPASNIIVYQTDTSTAQSDSDFWTLINNELQQIIDDNAHNTASGSIVSISLGEAEVGFTQDVVTALDQSFQTLKQSEHMTVFVSSGDCAAFMDHQYGSLSVSYPATDPYVTAVGGTILEPDQNGNRQAEAAWADGSDKSKCTNQWGTGGGLSQIFKQPSWQTGVGVKNQYSNGARQLPDVSAIAYDVAMYFQGQWQAVGGTSAAAPIWAAGLALVNQGLIQTVKEFGYGPGLFYLIANHSAQYHPYFDVRRGSNLYYNTTAGWDYPTGLGAPNLVDFYRALLKIATSK